MMSGENQQSLRIGLIAVVVALCSLAGCYSTAKRSEPRQKPKSDTYVLAEKEDPKAQHNLGEMYETGNGGFPKNHAEAIKWYRKAAAQGLAASQFALGEMYRRGEGVPHDSQEAVRWYIKAAEQGLPCAQHNLGIAYYRGDGVPRDQEKALVWIRKAAVQGWESSKTAIERFGPSYEVSNTTATFLGDAGTTWGNILGTISEVNSSTRMVCVVLDDGSTIVNQENVKMKLSSYQHDGEAKIYLYVSPSSSIDWSQMLKGKRISFRCKQECNAWVLVTDVLFKGYSAKNKEQKSLSRSSHSQFQRYPSNIQIDIPKEIARLGSDDPIEKEDAAFKLSCQPERARSAIPHLIELLDDETPVTVRSQAPFPALADHYIVVDGDVRLAANSALCRITGKTGGVANWHQWWSEHEKEFKTAEADKDKS